MTTSFLVDRAGAQADDVDCIAQFSRLSRNLRTDLEAGRHLDPSPFARSATTVGSDILQYSEYNGQVEHHTLTNIIRLYHEGLVIPAQLLTSALGI